MQSLKLMVNSALRRVGYEVRRATHSAPPVPPSPAAPPVKPKAPPVAKAPARPAQQRSKSPAETTVPAHFDSGAREIISRVSPRTMTSPVKLYGLVQALRYLEAHQIQGDIVECGVWRGGSMQAAAYQLQELGNLERRLYLFDTFEGMSEPTEHDKLVDGGRTAAELLATHGPRSSVWAIASLEDVQAGMAETGYPADRVCYVPGKVEDTVPLEAPDKIALLRLDTDWYESTKHELEQLYPRLVPGGVLIIDDYGHWEGARKATEEFLSGLDHHLMLLPLNTGRIAIKPPW